MRALSPSRPVPRPLDDDGIAGPGADEPCERDDVEHGKWLEHRVFKAGHCPTDLAIFSGSLTLANDGRSVTIRPGAKAMAQKITMHVRALVEAAESEIDTLSADTAVALHGRDDVVFV